MEMKARWIDAVSRKVRSDFGYVIDTNDSKER